MPLSHVSLPTLESIANSFPLTNHNNPKKNQNENDEVAQYKNIYLPKYNKREISSEKERKRTFV